jgi:hypothetical protein
MAKKLYKAPKHNTGRSITTKTPFGSHKEMVVDHSTINGISILEGEVVCKDDDGLYVTNTNRIDNGLADPNRYANVSKRISGLDITE